MQYVEELGAPPSVGIELEFANWQRRTMLTVAADLKAAGYMLADSTYDRERHDYHCRCNTCTDTGTNMNYPPLWKMQRDASLPVETGAEFISSPFPAAEPFAHHAVEAFNIMTRGAVYPKRGDRDRDGRQVSVGMHVHCFAPGPFLRGAEPRSITGMIDMYSMFLPELLALATTVDDVRGIEYRTPYFYSEIAQRERVTRHHNWLAYVENFGPPRLEWRLWETGYGDPEYFLGALFTSAGLTQLLFNPKTMKKLLGIGYILEWDQSRRSKLTDVTSQVERGRLEILQDAVINGSAVGTDPFAERAVTNFFGRIR